MLKYKGYIGQMEIDEDGGVLYGRVLNLARDGVTFSGRTVAEAKEDFTRAVEDYLAWAKEERFEPEKPYGGKLLIRATPELHRQIALAAALLDYSSANQFVLETVREKLTGLRRSGDLPATEG